LFTKQFKKDTMMGLMTKMVIGVGLAAASGSGAFATPVTFTWSPTAVGLATSPTNSNIVANNFNVADFVDITVNNSTGLFTERAVLTALQFLNGGAPVPLNGLQTTYSFYATVTAVGSQSGIPAIGSGLSAAATFESAHYTFWASPNGQPIVTPVSGGAPTIAGNAGAFALFGGTLFDGTGTLTAPAGGGFSPTANLDLSITTCTAAGQVLAGGGTCSGNESAFFVDPLPQDLDLLVGNFSATTSVTTLTPGSAQTKIDINGGGGNITLSTDIMEPASFLILLSGLLATGLFVHRRAGG
jgi:hypothetical protein